jgi:hypothetical protein
MTAADATYADQRGHDVAWMTAAERQALSISNTRTPPKSRLPQVEKP